MPRIALLAVAAFLGVSIAQPVLAAGSLGGGLPGPILVTPPPTAGPQGVLAYRTVAEPPHLPVYAIMGTRLLVGESRPDPIGPGGALVLKDENQPGYACTGRYLGAGRQAAWSQKTEGAARVDCSDGAQFQVAYSGTLGDSGVGCGSAYAQTVSLCYGFAARGAARRLTAPAGYTLVVQRGRLSLKPDGV